jgi:nitrate reductase NapE component
MLASIMVWTVVLSVSARVGVVVEGSVRDFERDFERARSDVATAGSQDVSQRSGRRRNLLRRAHQPSTTPRAQGESGKSRRNSGSVIFRVLKRVWIPLVVLVVIGAGGFTVSRLHGIFGAENRLPYADSKVDDNKPFNPKHLRYEIFGPPGTVADVSYFGDKGDPEHADGVSLPWSLEFPITTAAGIGSIAAQGNNDSIGCRILVDGVVKDEKITHEVSAFVSCLLKAA